MSDPYEDDWKQHDELLDQLNAVKKERDAALAEVERLRKANFRMLDKLLRIRQVLDEDTDWTTPDSEASDDANETV